MKQRKNIVLFTTWLCITVAACGRSDTTYLEQATSEEEVFVQDTEAAEIVKEVSEERKKFETEIESTEDAENMSGVCYVYICGAVLNPGVYEVPQGSRIYEVIQRAGGLMEDASRASVNQAETVLDGQMIFLPTVEEAAVGIGVDALTNSREGDMSAMEESDKRVNLNTATVEELMTLSGIGKAKAEDILAYRETCGGFSSVEEIMNVAGIKEGLYNRIKDDIRVK